MNYIKKCTANNISAINTALNSTLRDMCVTETYITKLTNGAAVVDGKMYSVWTNGNDVFVTPDYALDWIDGEWTGTSANGVYFTILDCQPSVITE